MIRRLQITEKDRLLAAGLLSFIVAFLLVGWGLGAGHSIEALMIVGVFAVGPLVFSISPLRRGSLIQRLLAVVFILPSLAYVIIVIRFFAT